MRIARWSSFARSSPTSSHATTELATLRNQLDDVRQTAVDSEDIERLDDQAVNAAGALDALHRELLEIGCVLKDWRTGLVDFPALRDGQRIWLCWRLGEQTISHWHGLHEGFAGRRPISRPAN